MRVRRALLGGFACLFFAAACGDQASGGGQTAEAPQPPAPEDQRPSLPNLILFSADGLRVDHLSGSGYGRDTTPALAKTALRGVVFDAAFTPFPDAVPAHGSMLTGLDPGVHGLLGGDTTLRADAVTLGELLQTQGYATAGFVSRAELGPASGLGRGFDVYSAPPTGRRPGGLTLLAALKWLARASQDKTRPFFLFVQLSDATLPYEPPDAHLKRFHDTLRPPRAKVPGPVEGVSKAARIALIARYDATLAYEDHVLGTLVQQLVRQQISTTTHVVITSAHGVTLTEREWAFDHGGRLYDEQLRVPLILRLGGGRHAGVNVGTPVSTLDVFATLAQLADVQAPPSMPSRSLMLHLGGKVQPRRPIYALANADTRRVPQLGAPLDSGALVAAVRVDGFKLIDYPLVGGSHVFELFDLARDGAERSNLAPEQPEPMAALIRLLGAWRLGTGVMGPAGAHEGQAAVAQ